MKNAVVAAKFALVCSCMVSPAEDHPESKSWREIAFGSQSNIQQATRLVIRDQEQWRKWWGEHNTVETMIDGKTAPEPPPDVDFSKETVLAATMGTRSSGGYGIRFTAVSCGKDVVTATLETTSPDPDGLVTRALTAPFCIISIPKHNGRVEFVDETAK